MKRRLRKFQNVFMLFLVLKITSQHVTAKVLVSFKNLFLNKINAVVLPCQHEFDEIKPH